jgi:hypothetical protein
MACRVTAFGMAMVEVVSSQLVILRLACEEMVRGHQHGVRDRDDRLLVAPTESVTLAWARIMYPAVTAGTGTPVSGVRPRYPVALFLHGRHFKRSAKLINLPAKVRSLCGFARRSRTSLKAACSCAIWPWSDKRTVPAQPSAPGRSDDVGSAKLAVRSWQAG